MGVLSTDLFKVYDNGLLDRVQQSGRGAKIGLKRPPVTMIQHISVMMLKVSNF